MPKYKLKYDRIGKPAKCNNCGEDKLWFVITVSDMTFCSDMIYVFLKTWQSGLIYVYENMIFRSEIYSGNMT